MLLYAPENVYQLDKAAVDLDGLAEIELMQRAGRSVWTALQARWPGLSAISILAGAGNNGGDAFVVAICARDHGVDVQLLVQGDLAQQSDTSRHFKELWEQGGGQIETWQAQPLVGDLIVDGLLGIGLRRELDDHWQSLITTLNGYDLPRVAIDIPSGLNGFTGNPQPVALTADLTVTFIGRKTGQFLADGPDYCGELIYQDLGVSSRTRTSIAPALEVVEICKLPPLRKKNSHKNHYGNLLIVGGDLGMSGAVTLAARAALRSGTGLVTALVHPECRHNLAAFPEIMVLGWDSLEARLAAASVVVVGPGLGGGDEARACLQLLAHSSLPMVIDAGALELEFLNSLTTKQRVITPHPGEAANLLSISAGEVQGDRIDSVRRLAERFDASVVLKGSGTLIETRASPTAINVRGNPGMASAGMGDVLSGVIASLLGQGLSTHEAARSGVFLHALAAEMYSQERDQSGLIASDVIEAIPTVMRQQRDRD